jgi:predicted permease
MSADQPRWRRYLRFFGPNADADVDDELAFHLEMRIRDYESRGLSRADAERAARERLGDLDPIQQSLRTHDRRRQRHDQRRSYMSDIVSDLRVVLRGLRRTPGFTVVAVATLALGVGANTGVFSVVDAVVIRALPYPHADQLAALSGSTLAELTRLRELDRSFTGIAAYTMTSVGVSGTGGPERVDAATVSSNLLSVLGVAPSNGRGFTPDEELPGHGNIVVLDAALATARFGAPAAAVGRTLDIDGTPHDVIGVMPGSFHFPSRDTHVWLSVQMPPSRSGAFWGIGGYQLVGRMRAGVTDARARDELRALFKHIRRENPVWDPGPTYGDGAFVKPLQSHLVGSARTMLWLLLGVVSLVLLIACANVANLLLVRATARRREFAIRAALGGGRGRLIRLALTESIALAVFGTLAGLVVAVGVMHLLVGLLPADTPRIGDVALDGRVLAFSVALAVATGIVFGLLPALRASAVSVAVTLQPNGRTGATKSHRRLTDALVCGEIAAAVMLVAGAILLVRSVTALSDIDPGFRVASITTARVSLPAGRYAAPGASDRFYGELLQRVAALPSVVSAAAVNRLPLTVTWGGAWRIAGQFEGLNRQFVPNIDHEQTVTPGYFGTIGIPLVAGRTLDGTDGADSPPVAVVSQSLAEHFWPRGNAIGQRIGHPYDSPWITIVGVVRDAKLDSLTGTSEQTIYLPLAQTLTTDMSIVIRTQGQGGGLAESLARIAAQIDPSVPVSNVSTMSDVAAASEARPRFTMRLLALFACLAVLLGGVGIYGVMSYGVAQRTREIGVRLALGATPRSALRMVLGQGLRLAGVGIAIGLIGAALTSRLLAGFLVGVGAHDLATFILAPLLLGAVALLASWLPARRATRIDPADALRVD